LNLKSNFNYDSLPVYLHSAITGYGITENYLVSVKSCEDENLLVLGYTLNDYTEKGEVPCGGRERGLGCYNIGITFPSLPAKTTGGSWQRPLLLGGTLLSLGYVAFVLLFLVKSKPVETAPVAGSPALTDEGLIRFGKTAFDPVNQAVVIGTTRQALTYREAKLLHVFCKNLNQVLERNQLPEEVWGDEGVIVGRSLDVFVSRLRKILKKDETVRLVNVHSVGYRLEVVYPKD
jgi:hypothetical protein